MSPIGEKITVTCACGSRLSAPLSAVGKTAPCPKCGAILTVPRPDEADFGAAPEEFDYSMGKGIRNACIAGVIAAAISTGLAVLVESDLGITAVGTGFACGLAMMAGTKRRAPEVGIIAAGITVVAVILSKVAIAVALAGTASGEQAAHAAIARKEAAHDQAVEQLVHEALPAQPAQADDEGDTPAGPAASAAPPPRQPFAQPPQPAVSVIGVLSVLLMLGMWDIIWLAGGIAAAYFTSTYNDG